ncbi:MAG: DUF262 domain-containing protein [Deltaproteobacteria bacterium]|nr:DUF262 domain-containing protein [Deltaproteobacteria bacterium]
MSTESGQTVQAEKPAQGEAVEEEALEGYEGPSPGGWEEYPLDQLAIRDERRTAIDVVRRIKQDRFVLDPDFQRDFVWHQEKQSRLIESILMRIPLPVFYVAEDERGRLIVVDGRQRLTTLQRFLEGELRLNLPDRPELHGKRLTDLDVRLQNRVEDCQLLFYIIDHSVPERARLDIFERVNGGEVLTRQQMRNAIYNGPATVFLREEAASDLFVDVTGRSLNAKKMQDREFINRFCAFSIFPIEQYRGNMDEWLARALREMNANVALIDDLRIKLHRSLRNNKAAFGKHAFRKHWQANQPRSVLNASLFDVMSTGLASVDEALAVERAESLRLAFYSKLMNNPEFIKAVTYSPNTPREVRKRFEIGRQVLGEVFGDS